MLYRKVKIQQENGEFSELQEFEALKEGDVFCIFEPDGVQYGETYTCLELRFEDNPSGVVCSIN
jgi:hypothetical protein